MYTLLRSLRSRYTRFCEPVSFIAALAIAELFYKFHSFLLETGAFLLTWLVLGAVIQKLLEIFAAETPNSERG